MNRFNKSASGKDKNSGKSRLKNALYIGALAGAMILPHAAHSQDDIHTYTQASQGWIPVTKSEFDRYIKLYEVPDNMVDSVMIQKGQHATDPSTKPFRVFTDNDAKYYRIDMHGGVPAGFSSDMIKPKNSSGSDNSQATESSLDGESVLDSLSTDLSVDTISDALTIGDINTLKHIKPIISSEIDSTLRLDIEDFFAEFMLTDQVYHRYVGPPVGVDFPNGTKGTLTSGIRYASCNEGFLISMGGKTVSVKDFPIGEFGVSSNGGTVEHWQLFFSKEDKQILDSYDHFSPEYRAAAERMQLAPDKLFYRFCYDILHSKGDLNQIYASIKTIKGTDTKPFAQEIRSMFDQMRAYVSAGPAFQSIVNTPEELFQYTPKDCLQDFHAGSSSGSSTVVRSAE